MSTNSSIRTALKSLRVTSLKHTALPSRYQPLSSLRGFKSSPLSQSQLPKDPQPDCRSGVEANTADWHLRQWMLKDFNYQDVAKSLNERISTLEGEKTASAQALSSNIIAPALETIKQRVTRLENHISSYSDVTSRQEDRIRNIVDCQTDHASRIVANHTECMRGIEALRSNRVDDLDTIEKVRKEVEERFSSAEKRRQTSKEEFFDFMEEIGEKLISDEISQLKKIAALSKDLETVKTQVKALEVPKVDAGAAELMQKLQDKLDHVKELVTVSGDESHLKVEQLQRRFTALEDSHNRYYRVEAEKQFRQIREEMAKSSQSFDAFSERISELERELASGNDLKSLAPLFIQIIAFSSIAVLPYIIIHWC